MAMTATREDKKKLLKGGVNIQAADNGRVLDLTSKADGRRMYAIPAKTGDDMHVLHDPDPGVEATYDSVVAALSGLGVDVNA